MNSYLNYLLEANIALLFFLGMYKLLFIRETNFRFLRILLLTGIFSSLIFPCIHIQNYQGISALSISQVIPSYWLPEVVIGNGATKEIHETSFNFWKYTSMVYLTGVIIVCLIVISQLIQLFRIIHRSTTYRSEQLYICESTEDKPIFSFFQFIFIGQAQSLSLTEKQQIIQHESVHARQGHSFDILLVNILKVFFWFNPFINTYKKIFIQLHEFEADARAVENTDVNKYCSLLARVALQSANLTLANYFNNSLTVKRIEMMRTLKTKIKKWKLVVLVIMVPFVFFFIACQDQVGDDLREITQNSTHALIAPKQVQARFEQLKKENPDKKYALLELNETASGSLKKLEEAYGLPKSIEVFNSSEGETGLPEKNELIILAYSAESSYSEIRVSETESKSTFAIVEFNDQTSKFAEALRSDDNIFTIVEEVASFPGGIEKLMEHLQNNMKYPEDARKAGKSGTVYIQFVVNEDGGLSDFKIIKGVGTSVDAEALRAVKTLPAWTPGKQNGVAIRQRYVLPISFNMAYNKKAEKISENLYKMKVNITKTYVNGKTIVEGSVLSEENKKSLAGTNIIIKGTSTGTTADSNGNFKLEIPKESGQLVFSFVGYEFKTVDF